MSAIMESSSILDNRKLLTPFSFVPNDLLIELNTTHNKICMLCEQKEISELLYGKLYQINGTIIHMFCVLFSNVNVYRNKKTHDWDFLTRDIKALISYSSSIICIYCKKQGASVKCCGYNCNKMFHFPCGLMNNSMHQYFETYKSFCQKHRVTQTIDLCELQSSIPVQCAICLEEIIPTPLPSSLWAPCCKRNAWFHRNCIKKLALNHGYNAFKCPLCNNVEQFRTRMLHIGIYLPERPPSWILESFINQKEIFKHNKCHVKICLCPDILHRYYDDHDVWKIILCTICKTRGTHYLCSNLRNIEKWYCFRCKELEEINNRRALVIQIHPLSVNSLSVTLNNLIHQFMRPRITDEPVCYLENLDNDDISEIPIVNLTSIGHN